MDRTNHYEQAFEAYLQWHGYCYIAVDETRRPTLGDAPVKSLDFLVYGNGQSRVLVDVKGRRFPGLVRGKDRHVWECWSVLEDIDGLERWRTLFGTDYQSLLVFSYELLPKVEMPDDTVDLWTWRGRRYLYRAVPVDGYRQHMRLRSPKWGTVDLPGAVFRRLAQPLHHFLQPAAAEEAPF